MNTIQSIIFCVYKGEETQDFTCQRGIRGIDKKVTTFVILYFSICQSMGLKNTVKQISIYWVPKSLQMALQPMQILKDANPWKKV